jgi:hypothetical protein
MVQANDLELWQVHDAQRIVVYLAETDYGCRSSAAVVRAHCRLGYYEDPAFWDGVERQLREIRGR